MDDPTSLEPRSDSPISEPQDEATSSTKHIEIVNEALPDPLANCSPQTNAQDIVVSSETLQAVPSSNNASTNGSSMKESRSESTTNSDAAAMTSEVRSITQRSSRSTQASGFTQTMALLRKNLLIKYRTPMATLLELFSPLFMMLVLALAYQLTEITYEDEAVYARIHLDLPGPLPSMLLSNADMINELLGSNTNRRLARTGSADSAQKQGPVRNWNEFMTSLHQNLRAKGNLGDASRYLEEEVFETEAPRATGLSRKEQYDLLAESNEELSAMLEGPIVVPTFSQYVVMASALSTAVQNADLPRVFTDSSYGRQWGNLLTLGTLHLSPRGSTVESFVEYLNDTYPEALNTSLAIRIHENEDEALRFIDDNLQERTWALMDFAGFSLETNQDKTYKIRMNYTTVPNTNEVTNYVSIGLDTDYQMYYLSGYMTLQRTVTEFVFAHTSGCNNTSEMLSSIWSMPMPTAAYSQNPFFLQVGYLLGLTMVMAYLYPIARFIKTLVEEKETRMKETLFILGVRGYAHWLSWVITALFVFAIVTVSVTSSLTAFLLAYSNPKYILLWVGLFSTAMIGFCFTIASLFSRAKLSAIMGPVALFATILPRFIFFGTNRYEATNWKMVASLLPATAFAFGADIVADYEYAEKGVQEWNAGEGDYSFHTCLGFLFFDSVAYIVLGWYLEQVIPRQYGVAKPFYFFLLPSYWTSCFGGTKLGTTNTHPVGPGSNDDDTVEIAEPGLVTGVQISNLTKQYFKRGEYPPAVNNLNLSLFESQITTLLGHNGAGKSSTVSILTGLYPPTSGDCVLYGKSIVHSLQEARQSIGICPQSNILFGPLSVYEHLCFFMRIKGLRPTVKGIEAQAAEIGLSSFLRTKASALSGGNKRKLSVAIALSGDPSVLVLDEPTSAMDPHSRRAVWQLLRSKREGRVTLLTTHFMDEAELLSDRVAVLKHGKLQCCGSPNFLKHRFGLGYNLTMVLEGKNTVTSDEEASCVPNTEHDASGDFEERKQRLLRFLEDKTGEASLVRSSGKELTVRFGPGSEACFPDTLNALETRKADFGLIAYGVQNSSLEEIFLHLADDDTDTVADLSHELPAVTFENFLATLSPIPGTPLSPPSFLEQIMELYKKRWIVQKRDVRGTVFSVVLPVIVIALVLLILMVEPPFVGGSLEVSPALYTNKQGKENQTEILVVSGSAGTGTLEAVRDLGDMVKGQYPFVSFGEVSHVNHSEDLSYYMLGSINDNDHPERYGAFVLDDTIFVEATLNTSEISEEDILAAAATLSALNSSVPSSTNVTDLSANVTSSIPDTSNSWVDLVLNLTTSNNVSLVEFPNISLIEEFIENSNVTAGNISSFEFEQLMSLLGGNNTDDVIEAELEMMVNVSILHNASSPHAVAAFNQAFNDFLHNICSSRDVARVIPVNEPLPLTTQQSLEVLTVLSVFAALFLLIPFCYIPGAFVVYLVKERLSKAKYIQLVSGVNMTAYWISVYMWDLTLFSLLTLMAMVVFLIYGQESAKVFVGDWESFIATMLLIFGYGFSILPFSYLLVRNSGNSSSAQITVIGVIFITGFVAVCAYFIMDALESTEDLAQSLRPLFRCWPAYNIGEGFIFLASAFWERGVLFRDHRPLDWDVTGSTVVLLFGLGPVYFSWLLLLEYSQDGGSGGVLGRFLRETKTAWEQARLAFQGATEESYRDQMKTTNYVDKDVLEEAIAVQANDKLQESSPVVLRNVWKIFPKSAIASCTSKKLSSQDLAILPQAAVRGLNFSVKQSETFGLLGTNGAGKTTTLGVLTGDVSPTMGQVFVAGQDVTGKISGGVTEARKHIGYCPQTDPLVDQMTGRDTLRMYCRLRGVPTKHVEQAVTLLLNRLTLNEHADKQTESYSGGNKRKLSLGIAALVGQGGVLLIDECSSGLDPLARKKLWNLIESLAETRSVIITTHSMEEAEALSNRVGIMVHGQFVAMGSVQQVKSKYLDGYTVEINCRPNCSTEEVDMIQKEVLTKILPGSIIVERHGRFLRFEISRVSTIGLGTTFLRLQELKKTNVAVENYSLSQCSLEQVFLKVVQDAEALRGEEKVLVGAS